MKRVSRILTAGALVALFAVLTVPAVQAAALTEARDTPMRYGETISIGVYTNTRIWAGSMVALNSSGYAVPAADTSGYIVIGRADETVDNRYGQDDAGDSGTLTIEVTRGVFRWANLTGITDADIGSFVYVEDDQSVDDDAPSQSIIAGICRDVDSDGVWVDTFHVGRTAGSYTTITASGKATFNGETEMNEDVDINLDASDEEIAITQAGAAGPGSAGLIVINDDRTGATANAADEATITIDAEGTYALGLTDGGIAIEGDIIPTVDDQTDLGSASAQLDDVYIDGQLYVDQLDAQYANKTGAYTNAATDLVLSYNTSAATTNTLPEASTVLGKVFVICLQDDDGDLVVITDGTDTFDGTNNQVTMADAGDSLWLQATAANVYTILVNVGGTLGTQ